MLVLFLFVLNANAQSSYFNVKESQKYKDQFSAATVLSVNTSEDNHTIIARSSKANLVFETFDDKVQGKKILNTTLERKEVFEGELFYDNKVMIFTVHSPSKIERIVNCHIYHIDTHTHEKVELFKTSVAKNGSLFSGQNKRQTNFAISPDKNFIAVATDNIKKTSNSYLIHVFDAKTLKLKYSKNYYSNPEKFFRSSDMKVDNQGNAYSIGKAYFKGKREKKEDKANYSFVLSKITEEDAVNTQQIELHENEYIQNLSMQINGNILNLIGYYSEKNAYGIKGVSQFKVSSKDLTVLDKKKSKLPIQVYEDIYGQNSAKDKKNRELTSFDLDHVLMDEEGNTFLVAEEFFITQTYVQNGFNTVGTYHIVYHYNDILITKFSPNGNLIWGRSIFKRSNRPSYSAFIQDDKLHVLLNSGKDLATKQDGRLKVSKGWLESTALYDFVYDKEGNLTREKIQDNKGKPKYIPYRGNYVDGKFVMYNNSGNSKQLMMLESK